MIRKVSDKNKTSQTKAENTQTKAGKSQAKAENVQAKAEKSQAKAGNAQAKANNSRGGANGSQSPLNKGQPKPDNESVLFLPLGGVGEIGMNATLYGHAGQWILVDLGASFADPLLPGANAILPDISFIAERREALSALIVTHAHEDHIGAIPWLWQKLRCPLYMTGFTAAILRRKWQMDGHGPMPDITIVSPREAFQAGPFEVSFVNMTHSIPEPSALILRSPVGTIFHSGDWKLDPKPVIGDNFDEETLKSLAQEKPIALICDSTNVFEPDHSGSESSLQGNFEKIFKEYKKGIAVTMFASNVSRLYTVAKAAQACGRTPVLVGQALERMNAAARECGYMDDLPDFPEFKEIGKLNRNQTVFICTGSQAEPRSALYRMAWDSHPYLKLNSGDAVLFSSRLIPGNEKPINHMKARLTRKGVEVISGHEHGIHVSGHPGQSELKQLYKWIKPSLLIPIHGEWQHLHRQILLADEAGIDQSLIAENGNVVRIDREGGRILGTVKSGQIFVDGMALIDENDAVFSERRKMMWNGAVAVTLFTDEEGVEMVQDPVFAAFGIDVEDMLYETAPREIEKAIRQADIRKIRKGERRSQQVMDVTERIIRRLCRNHCDKKPLTHINLVHLD